MPITSEEITLLKGLTNNKPICVKLPEGKALLHARWFALELSAAKIEDSKVWKDAPLNGALEWRALTPAGEGEYAQASRFTDPDGVSLIKLLSDSHTGFIHPALYEVVMKNVDEPEFRLFPGDKALVGIYSAGIQIGLTAQVKPG